MNRELRRAQLLRRFNDAEHKPEQIAGREIFIPIPDGRLRALIYAPDAAGPAPLFVDLHGGAYIFGSPEEDDHFCASLCRELGMALRGGRAGHRRGDRAAAAVQEAGTTAC